MARLLVLSPTHAPSIICQASSFEGLVGPRESWLHLSREFAGAGSAGLFASGPALGPAGCWGAFDCHAKAAGSGTSNRQHTTSTIVGFRVNFKLVYMLVAPTRGTGQDQTHLSPNSCPEELKTRLRPADSSAAACPVLTRHDVLLEPAPVPGASADCKSREQRYTSTYWIRQLAKNRDYTGAADKAVNLVGCKSPHHQLPGQVVSISDACGGDEACSARM